MVNLGSNIFDFVSSAIPLPLSSTVTFTSDPSENTITFILGFSFSSGMACIEFLTKLVTTLISCVRSNLAIISSSLASKEI